MGSKRHTLVDYYRKGWAGEVTGTAAGSNIGDIIPLVQFLWREREVSERGYKGTVLISTEAPIIFSGKK